MDTQSVTPFLPGDVVGRYRVEDFVAEGGMGKVFRAWDSILERRVALKVIQSEHASEKVALTRFKREAQILAKLDYPGICHVYDWLDHQGTLVMAMEWVDGTPLSALIEAGPLPAKQVIQVVREIAVALAAAHGKGIIHRDLKPSNILITKDGTAKILDFGLAKSSGEGAVDRTDPGWAAPVGEEDSTLSWSALDPSLTQPGAIMGTLGFLAPEILLGESHSASADLYALGVIASMALTGDKNHSSQDGGNPWARSILRSRTSSVPHPPGPRALWSLVDRMLAPDPEQRPEAQEVVEALSRMQAPTSAFWWSASSVLVTVVLMGAALWIYGRGALPEFSARRRARVVVLPVQNLTPFPQLNTATRTTTTALLEFVLRSSFPKVEVVRDGGSLNREGAQPRPGDGGRDQTVERAFIGRLVERTGADLVLQSSLMPDSDAQRVRLQLRVLDSKGQERVTREVMSGASTYAPDLAVTGVLKELGRAFSPLGRSLALPTLPSGGALEAFGKGWELVQQGEESRSLPYLEKAAHAAPTFGPVVLGYGAALAGLGDAKARPTLMWARSVATLSGDKVTEARVLIHLARLATRETKPDEEKALLQEALGLAKAIGDRDLQARVMNQLGSYWINRGDWPAASEQLKQALQLASAQGSQWNRCGILVNLGNVAWYEVKSSEARAYYQEALGHADLLERPLLCATLNNLAILDLADGRIEEAERGFREVMRVYRELGDAAGVCRQHRNLGIVAFMKGAIGEAQQQHEAALAGARRLKDVASEAMALYYLGDLLRAQGKLAAAKNKLWEALHLMRQTGKPDEQASTLATLAECMARTGDLREAERLLSEAHGLGGGDRPQAWKAQAWVFHHQGRQQEALEALERALADRTQEDIEHRQELEALLREWRKKA